MSHTPVSEQMLKLHERCRAYAIALKVIDESMLPADQKEDLIGQMFKPILAANVEVELSDIRQALSRGSDLQSVGILVRPTRSPEIQWVIDQRQQQKPKASAAQMTKLISEEQAAVARKADIWGVLSHFGLDYTPPVQRMWSGKSMCWTSITRCPVCAQELWIDNADQRWMCKTCRSGGDVIHLVQHATACTAQRAIAWLSGDAPMPDHRSKSARQHALAKTRRIEDVARRYGLTVTETTERPEAPGYWCGTGWLRGGKTFITTCPICKGPLFVYIDTDHQKWTCRKCSRGYMARPDHEHDGDAIDSCGTCLDAASTAPCGISLVVIRNLNENMSEDKGTQPTRRSRGKDDDFLFGSTAWHLSKRLFDGAVSRRRASAQRIPEWLRSKKNQKGRRPIIIIGGKRSSSPRPSLGGNTHRKTEGPFCPQAASQAMPLGPACEPKATHSHTPRSAARFSACRSTPKDLCPRTLLFRNSVAAQTAVPQALPRWSDTL
jgi:uncharacterized protein YbaR (Trm112 family)